MGIGAAIGGLAQGFAQGVKLKSDLQDAEERRGLMKLQAIQTQQQLDMGTQQAEARKDAASVIQGYRTGNAELGFVRGQDGSYDPNLPENLNRYYDLSRQSAANVAIAYGRSPAVAMAEVDELRKKGFAEQVNFASAQLGMGDFDGASSTLKKVWPLMGDKREFVGVGLDPNDPKNAIIQFKAPGADEVKTTSVPVDKLANNIIPYALNLNDSANFRAANRRIEQDDKRIANDGRRLELQEEEIKNLQSWRSIQERLQSRELDIKASSAKSLAAYYATMGQAALAPKETQALNNQLGAVTTLLGIDRNFDPNKASVADIADHKQKLSTANTAMYLINEGFRGGKLTMNAPQAILLAGSARNPEFTDVKKEGPGMYFVVRDGIKIPVGYSDAQYDAAKAAYEKAVGLPATPPPRTSPPGIKTPGAISLFEKETREIERGIRRDYSPQAIANMQATEQSIADAEVAERRRQAELLRSEQQRMIEASRNLAAQSR